MGARTVAVIGGGPGGLYAARLIRLACPDWSVTVHEHNDDGDTFGFGVGLTPDTLRSLSAADPATASAIRAAGHVTDGMEMRVGRGTRLQGRGNLAIGRAELLQILREHACAAGVELSIGHVETPDLDADLIIAADGVRSGTREKLVAEFGATVDLDDALYLWAGTDFAFDCATFAPAFTDAGVFVVHAYPYAPGRSTFLVETDERTWRAAGLDEVPEPAEAGSSDERSLALLSDVFGDLLPGHRLLGNRTRWQRFATVRCARWTHDNVVLLGDAAHTAHYSIGSGTKLALEDAIALAGAVREFPEIADALTAYETNRRPRVERFQSLAARSHAWWKSFPRRLDLEPARLMTSFLTRAGNLTVDDIGRAHPEVVAAAVGAYRGDDGARTAGPDGTAAAVLDAPLGLRSGRVVEDAECRSFTAVCSAEVRDAAQVWGPDGSAVVDQARRLVAAGESVVWLPARDDSRPVALVRADLGERIRRETGARVGIDLPAALRADAVGALLAGRVDLVRFC